MSEIGMGGTNLNTEMMKVTKPDRLKQTPADMTGNELDFNEKRRKKDKKDGEEEEEIPTDENVWDFDLRLIKVTDSSMRIIQKQYMMTKGTL